jgi:ATP/maltotriose-dependent transcriptional regulator MalT
MVSETTIKTHLLHIYNKLGVRDRAAAVAAAYKQGLLG